MEKGYTLSVCRAGYYWVRSSFESLEAMRAAYDAAIKDRSGVLAANMYGPDGRHIYPYVSYTRVAGVR